MTNPANSGGEYGQGWDVKEASKKLKIEVLVPTLLLMKSHYPMTIELNTSQVVTRNEREMEFDMIGYDPSMVNALRRSALKSFLVEVAPSHVLTFILSLKIAVV